jgi:hypothetical protein
VLDEELRHAADVCGDDSEVKKDVNDGLLWTRAFAKE